MILRPDRLAPHLAQDLRTLYTVHGDEPLLAQEAADTIRAAARQAGYTERVVHSVAAHFDWSELLASLGAMSLFGDRQLIEVRIPSGKPGKDGSEGLQSLCKVLAAQAAQDVLVLVQLPRLDRTALSSAWFTALQDTGVVLRVEPIERGQLPAWIAQRLAAVGLRVADGEEGQRALTFFADRVEGNLLAAHQEVQKLALLHPPHEGNDPDAVRVLGYEAIESAVLDVARYDVFKLGEAVLAGQTGRIVRMIEGLQAEGQAAVLVHWTLAEDLRALLRARQALQAGRPMAMVLREQRIWGVKEKLFERLLPVLPLDTLLAWTGAAHEVDGVIKGLKLPHWPQDEWHALQRLALQIGQWVAQSTVQGGTRLRTATLSDAPAGRF